MIPKFLRRKQVDVLAPALLLFLTSAVNLQAQTKTNPFKGYEHLFTAPKQYHAKFTSNPPVIDGDLSDQTWNDVPWTDAFIDIEGGKRQTPRHATKCKMVWDKDYLYIAAFLDEPHVWGNINKHDDIIFYDNDFEIFIDPDNDTHNYFEIELNALNTSWDLFLAKPYRALGSALFNWEAKGMKTAVKVDGTINNPSDIDKGWSIEFAIPYQALQIGNDVKVPKAGAFWRINFSRVEWDTDIVNGKYVKRKDASGKTLPENNWVWSPQGVINMHLPERWGYLHFDDEKSAAKKLPAEETLRKYLWLVYYKQTAHHNKQKRYANTLQALDMAGSYQLDGKPINLSLEATANQFLFHLNYGNKRMSINQEGALKTYN